jgi:hypothetical protein
MRYLAFSIPLSGLLLLAASAARAEAVPNPFEKFEGLYAVTHASCSQNGQPTEVGCDEKEISVVWDPTARAHYIYSIWPGTPTISTGVAIYETQSDDSAGTEKATITAPDERSALWTHTLVEPMKQELRERRLLSKEREVVRYRVFWHQRDMYDLETEIIREYVLTPKKAKR